MTALYQPISALTLLRQLEGNEQARRHYLRECLARMHALDPQLNALTAVTDEASLLAASDAAHGPLGGLPVLLKDIIDTRDLPTAYGSAIYQGHRPAADAAVATLLRRQGAALAGKTVTCEFAYMAAVPTRNPSAPARTAGGSSSGSAAAVAAGFAPFALGTQTGGSTIRPAAFCGIAGYKPSFGMLPTAGIKCFSWSFDTVGLFAAGVRDAAYLAQALSGQRLAVPSPLPGAPVFGVPDSYPWGAPSANAARALASAIRAIERAGGTVRPLRLAPWMAALADAHATIQGYESSRTLGYEYDRHRDQLTSKLRDFLARAGAIDTGTYLAACAQAEAARGQCNDWFGGIDALLTPSAPDEAPEGLATTGDPVFNRNWTLLGTPCVSVPGLHGDHGAPLGIQVIGRRGDDARTLASAAFVENALLRHA